MQTGFVIHGKLGKCSLLEIGKMDELNFWESQRSSCETMFVLSIQKITKNIKYLRSAWFPKRNHPNVAKKATLAVYTGAKRSAKYEYRRPRRFYSRPTTSLQCTPMCFVREKNKEKLYLGRPRATQQESAYINVEMERHEMAPDCPDYRRPSLCCKRV